MSAGPARRIARLEARAAALPAPVRYGVAAALTGIAVLGAEALAVVDAPAVFAPVLLAVALAVWLLGTGAGIAVAALGGVATPFFVLPPHLSLAVSDGADAVGLLAYLLTAAGIVALGHAARAARRRAEVALGRSALLAEAGLALEAPTSVEERLQELVRIAVPRLADWCAIDLPGPDGAPRWGPWRTPTPSGCGRRSSCARAFPPLPTRPRAPAT